MTAHLTDGQFYVALLLAAGIVYMAADLWWQHTRTSRRRRFDSDLHAWASLWQPRHVRIIREERHA